ncbi:MAG: hypothetical protein COA83_07560 [Methylophaga sp.]|nr:MAG: hypothetical protein COA83_07560 [Methylophaga sp.]
MKKLIGVLVVIAVLSLVSAAAYIYFSSKSAVDSLIESAQPFANVNYQRFSNPMDGSISIHGVTIGDDYGSSVDVGSIELKMDSVLDYINFEKKITSGEILPKLQLQINHLYADLDFIKKIQGSSDRSAFETINAYIDALGCGDVKTIGTEQLSDLGYSGLDSSVNLNFEYNKSLATVTMEFDYIMHGMSSFLVKTSIPYIYTAQDFADLNNKVGNLVFELQDLGYNESIIEHCSLESELERDVYIEQHLQQLKNYLTKANIQLSDDLYAAYRAYFVDKATLTFTSQPDSAVNLQYINLYKTEDWPAVLGLSIAVNDDPVNDVTFSWNKDTVIKNLMNAREGVELAKIDDDEARDPQTRSKQVLRNKTHFEIPVSDLDKYIKSNVKLETKLGKTYTGYIKGVTRSQVIVVIRLKGGKAEIPVGTNKIAKAFIYQ